MARLRYRVKVPITFLTPRQPKSPLGLITATVRDVDIVNTYKAVATYFSILNRTGADLTITLNNGDVTFTLEDNQSFDMDNTYVEQFTLSGTSLTFDIVLGVHDINELTSKKQIERIG